METQSQAKIAENNELEVASKIYNGLEEDIQKMLVEEGDKWISLFNELIESNECMSLKYQCLIEPVTKIIQNETALAKMCKLDNLFSYTYIQHFHIKENTFSLVSDPYISMCMEIVMRRYQ